MREIILDTETTGLDPKRGDRVIEIGCIEMFNRIPTGREYHCFINPEREVDAGAFQVHGISNERLADKPKFAQIADEVMRQCRGDAKQVIDGALQPVQVVRCDAGHSGRSERREGEPGRRSGRPRKRNSRR